MRQNFTIEQLKNKPCAKLNQHLFCDEVKKSGKNIPKNIPQRRKSKEKDWIILNLQYWCNEHALEMVPELQFNQYRKYRFDWAILAIKTAIEYEGIFSEKSGHTTISGFTKDTDKYNLALKDGWRVLRYTAMNYKNMINDLNKIIDKKINNESI